MMSSSKRRTGRPEIVAVVVSVVCVGPAVGQSVPEVVPGWGVDTVTSAWSEGDWHGEVAAIYRTWRTYLTSHPERQQPTPLWSEAEQRRWTVYDHTAGIAYKGFPATVLDIRPAGSENPGEFVIRTLFASASGEAREVKAVALTRVYASRESGRWVLGSTLPRATRNWRRTRVGTFTYVSDPARPFDMTRARRAVAFADSLADALGVAEPENVTYVVAGNPEELHRLMGIDWTFGGLGHGYTLGDLVLNGDPAFAEENRHEITHLVLQPIAGVGRLHGIVSEGLATWLGGSVGRSFETLLPNYSAYLAGHPEVTLDSILSGVSPDAGWNPAGAVLVRMVFERAGTAGLLELLRSGRRDDELRAAAARLLDESWQEVQAEWRRDILDSRIPSSPEERP